MKKGELKWEFDPDLIGKSGFSVEELHTAALIVKGGYGLTVPLAGYFNEKVAWKKFFKEEKEQQPDLRAAEAILLEEPKQSIKETAKKTIQLKQENKIVETEPEQPKQPQNIVKEQKISNTIQNKKETSSFQKNFKDMLFNFKRELEKLEQSGVLTKEEQKHITEIKTNTQPEQTVVQQQKQQNEQKTEIEQEQKIEMEQNAEIVQEPQATIQSNTMATETNKEIAYILQNNDTLQPFEEGIWKSIALEELAVLPVNITEVMKNLFYICAYRKYKHFIFQKTAEKESG